MDISALSDLNLVARHGGFGGASRATGRSKATLSRRIAELETQLGVRLFERGVRGLRLTDAGNALHQRTEPHFGEIEAAAASIVRPNGRLSGRLRISAAVLFAQTHLGRVAAAFAQSHPEVDLSIVADDNVVAPVEQEYDIVIRANPADDDELVGRCFLRTDRVAVAIPTLPAPTEGCTLKVVDRVGEASHSTWRLRSGSDVLTVHTRSSLHLSSLAMIRDAVLAGAGAALLPRTPVDADLAAGRLVSSGVQDGANRVVGASHLAQAGQRKGYCLPEVH